VGRGVDTDDGNTPTVSIPEAVGVLRVRDVQLLLFTAYNPQRCWVRKSRKPLYGLIRKPTAYDHYSLNFAGRNVVPDGIRNRVPVDIANANPIRGDQHVIAFHSFSWCRYGGFQRSAQPPVGLLRDIATEMKGPQRDLSKLVQG
jgi:hypothetical protein